jgi:CHAD domain-containing protein
LANDRLREQQRIERRAMVKALEKLELERLRKTIARWNGHGSGFSTVMRLLRQPAWVDDIWTRITERAAAVIRAVERAPGTYFPKRAHKTRIAVKKLRYAVEVAAETGTWQPPERLLGDLRKIQGTLGDIHDAQVVVEAIDDLLGDRADSREASILRELYQDDIARGYTRYSRRRDRIRAIADACASAAARHRSTTRQTRALAAVSLATAPLFLSASQSSRSPRHIVVTSSG